MRGNDEISRLLIGVTAALFLAAGAEAATVSIDCDGGGIVQKVLDRGRPGPLTVEIAGTCEENVVVRRDGVALVGVEPGAAIVAAAGDAVTVEGAHDLTVESLVLLGGPGRAALWLRAAGAVEVLSSELGGSSVAMHAEASGPVRAFDSTFEGSFRAVWVAAGSHVTLFDSTIEGGTAGVGAFSGAELRILGGDVSAGTAVETTDGIVLLNGADATSPAGQYALRAGSADRGGRIEARGPATITGSILAEGESTVALAFDAVQLENAAIGGNVFDGRSTLFLSAGFDGEPVLIGETRLREFARGVVRGGTLGELYCETPADVTCDSETDADLSTCGGCQIP